MLTIEEFPEDGHFWLVKWIDGFRHPHGATRTASVTVLLQQLPFANFSQLSRLSRADVPKLVGMGSGNEPPPTFESRRVHVGLIPALRIGQVFHNRTFVGELPVTPKSIDLPEVEGSCWQAKIGDLLHPPYGWDPARPYKLLHAKEYSGIQSPWSESQCLVYTDTRSTTDIIIPRSVIFASIYACDSQFALAMTEGPWSRTRARIVFEGDLESGLKTQARQNPLQWDVVIQSRVNSDLIHLAALFYFDDFARRCAESIYTRALQERNYTLTKEWHASAQIPFQPCGSSLHLGLRGYPLAPRVRFNSMKETKVLKNSFLATEICEISWPPYIPPIGGERFNSNNRGAIHSDLEEDRPYRRGLHPVPMTPDVLVTAGTDGSEAKQTYVGYTRAISLIGAPAVVELKKDSSKSFSTDQLLGTEASTMLASAGTSTHESGNPSQLQLMALKRDHVNRFAHLLEALGALKSSGIIEQYFVVSPADVSRRAQRGTLDCWNLLDEIARHRNRWPRSGWEMLKRATMHAPGVPRAAFATRISYAEKIAYLLELECRPSEDGYCMSFVGGRRSDDQDIISRMVDTNLMTKGRNLDSALRDLAAEIGMKNGKSYRHEFAGNEDTRISLKSLETFLRNWWT